MARKRILRMQRKTGPRERTRLALENAIFEEVHMSCLTHTHFTVVCQKNQTDYYATPGLVYNP